MISDLSDMEYFISYMYWNTWFNFAERFKKRGCLAPLSETGSTKGFCIYTKLLNEMRSGNKDS